MAYTCSITEVSWARVHLTLTASLVQSSGARPPREGTDGVSGEETLSELLGGLDESVTAKFREGVRFFLKDGPRVHPVKSTRVDQVTYRLDINVTDFRSRRQVPDGTWRVLVLVDGQFADFAGFSLAEVDRLDEDSRVFLYQGNRVAYTVSFGITESDHRPDFVMRTYQLFRPAKKAASPKITRPVSRFKHRYLTLQRRNQTKNQWYRAARRLNPPKGNRILFASEMRSKLEGNLLAVHDRMVERGLDKEFEFRYSFRVPSEANRQSTLRTIYLIATSDYVLIDDYFHMLEPLNISSATKIIQLWHAGSGFKAVGYSRFGKYGSPKLQNAHRKYTYCITGSKHLVPVYAEAFGIEESAVIPTGLPRIDTFLDPERTAEVVRRFFLDHPHLEGKRIILFAPTFRGRSIADAYYDYSKIDFAQLHRACGDDAVVLFKMHHFVKTPVPIPAEFGDRLFDFAAFPQTNDLLQVTDVLVTDYSSIVYEYSLLDRPMLFFAYDKEIYAATRGFHRDYDLTAPGKVCTTFDELTEAISKEDYDTWKIEYFRAENFDRIDTHSSDRVIDWLILGEPQEAMARAEMLEHPTDPTVTQAP